MKWRLCFWTLRILNLIGHAPRTFFKWVCNLGVLQAASRNIIGKMFILNLYGFRAFESDYGPGITLKFKEWIATFADINEGESGKYYPQRLLRERLQANRISIQLQEQPKGIIGNFETDQFRDIGLNCLRC